MKKVTMTFIVSDEVANEIQNDLAWGLFDYAAKFMFENGEESRYDIKDVKE